ncbi:Ammonium transporter 2 member 5 [Linum perenne]
MMFGAGLLWMGWTGFNGGDPFSVNRDASLAVLNTHVCTATSLLTWLTLDIIFFRKSSIIGAIQGMITGLVCITPAAVMVVHKNWELLQKVDDTMAVFHTHAVAGTLGGILTGLFAEPRLNYIFYATYGEYVGLLYGFNMGDVATGFRQIGVQLLGIVFIVGLNIVSTTVICLVIQLVVPMEIGDEAAHGEEAYAIWGSGERYDEHSNLGM